MKRCYFTKKISVFFCLVVGFHGWGCAENGAVDLICEPGKGQECPCGGGKPTGVQYCRETGDGWDRCDCGWFEISTDTFTEVTSDNIPETTDTSADTVATNADDTDTSDSDTSAVIIGTEQDDSDTSAEPVDTNPDIIDTTIENWAITYYDNGSTNGTVPVDTNRYPPGTSATILANSGTLEKTGFAFAGWNTEADGSGDAFDAGQSIVMGESHITLFAQWMEIEYTISYFAGSMSATGSMIPQVIPHGESANLRSCEYANDGYYFNGWSTTPAGAVDYEDAAHITPTQDISLFAVWAPKTYSITYYLSGGTNNAANPQTYTYASPDIVLGAPVRNSYTFDGWYLDHNFTVKIEMISTQSTENVVLYAKWIIQDGDGNIYPELSTGNQVWLAQNLHTTSFNDGTPIFPWSDSIDYSDALFYDGGTLYGGYYNGPAVRTGKLCPEGWHIPDTAEWESLQSFVGDVAKALASTSQWAVSADFGDVGYNPLANNTTGFDALPAGIKSASAAVSEQNLSAYFWVSTIPSDAAQGQFFYLNSDSNALQILPANADTTGASVRCIRNY